MTKEKKQEYTLRISQANSTQLTVILYEMGLDYLSEAKEFLAAGEIPSFHEAARKTRGCLTELMESLNLEYEPAGAMLQLFLFCIRRLAYSELRKDGEALGEIERVIRPLHDAFAKIQDRNPSGPVMGNTQAVYAGLTYGRNSLVENTSDPGANRGMFA